MSNNNEKPPISDDMLKKLYRQMRANLENLIPDAQIAAVAELLLLEKAITMGMPPQVIAQNIYDAACELWAVAYPPPVIEVTEFPARGVALGEN